MTTVRCAKWDEFLHQLFSVQASPHVGTWYFRGQPRASTWRNLTPSLFRRLKSRIDAERYEELLIAELKDLLRSRSMVPDRLFEKPDDLLALAQHYGCPTRLLDWTLSPLTAAYFAASGMLQRPPEEEREPFSVFAITSVSLMADHCRGTKIADPLKGANANLAAQSGVLIKHEWDCQDLWQDEFETTVITPPDVPHVDPFVKTQFLRFELPAEQAGNLLAELMNRGVDSASLFPGMSGFVSAAMDRVELTFQRIREGIARQARRDDVKRTGVGRAELLNDMLSRDALIGELRRSRSLLDPQHPEADPLPEPEDGD